MAGYRGTLCETEIDPCLSQPCRNGATCNSLEGGSYSCTCPLGTTGLYCGVDINECESQPCQNGGQCSQPGLGSFQCACEPGYTGETCAVGEFIIIKLVLVLTTASLTTSLTSSYSRSKIISTNTLYILKLKEQLLRIQKIHIKLTSKLRYICSAALSVIVKMTSIVNSMVFG